MSKLERVEGLNPERIRWCMGEYDQSMAELAAATKISEKTLTKALAGEPALSFYQLQQIAQHFHRGVLFFLEAEPVSALQLHSPQFRTLTNMKPHLSGELKALVERVEKQRDIYLSLLEDIGESPKRKWRPASFPADGAHNIKAAAAFTRRWLKLGDRETFESYRQAMEAQGLLVFRSNGYAGKWQIPKDVPVRGFSLYFEHFPVIFVKKQATEGPQVFSLMHELGHLLLHEGSFIDEEEDFHSYRGKEKAANAFAAQVLVPDAFLNQVDWAQFPHDDVRACDRFLTPLTTKWSVSGEVVLRRLVDEGRLDPAYYADYRAWRSALPKTNPQQGGGSRFRYKEPLHVFGRPYVETVFEALHTKKITLARASTYLDHIKISDLRNLERTHVHA